MSEPQFEIVTITEDMLMVDKIADDQIESVDLFDILGIDHA